MSETASFKENYKLLKDAAEWLSKQDEPDIDELVPKVEEAMKAYQVCKDRLDSVKAKLGTYLQTPLSSDGQDTDEAF